MRLLQILLSYSPDDVLCELLTEGIESLCANQLTKQGACHQGAIRRHVDEVRDVAPHSQLVHCVVQAVVEKKLDNLHEADFVQASEIERKIVAGRIWMNFTILNYFSYTAWKNERDSLVIL